MSQPLNKGGRAALLRRRGRVATQPYHVKADLSTVALAARGRRGAAGGVGEPVVKQRRKMIRDGKEIRRGKNKTHRRDLHVQLDHPAHEQLRQAVVRVAGAVLR